MKYTVTLQIECDDLDAGQIREQIEVDLFESAYFTVEVLSVTAQP